MPIIGVITDASVGGTFLSWSLHFLAGHTDYFCVSKNAFLPVPNNPLQSTNAHNFNANHPDTLNDFETIICNLEQQDSKNFQIVYFHQLTDLNNSTNFEQQWLDTSAAIEKCSRVSHKIIRLSIAPHDALYFSSYHNRVLNLKWGDPSKTYQCYEEQHQGFIDTFFEDSAEYWRQHNLTSCWDHREFLALNLRPYNIKYISSLHKFNFDFFNLDCRDCWTTLDTTIHQIFNYLETPIDKHRLEHWKIIYTQWKQFHYQRIQYITYFNTIINNILNNQPMDLERFNLDLVQEAIIQHTLIYQHNLNLKTWQLEKFINTSQLHNLLEPNSHILSSY